MINKPYIGGIHKSLILPEDCVKIYKTSIKGKGRDHSNWDLVEDINFDNQAERLLEEIIRPRQRENGLRGIPQVYTLMPHVTAGWRVGNPRDETEQETNWHREGLFDSRTFEDKLGENTHFMACPVELYVFGEERKFWDQAEGVADYFRRSIKMGGYDGSKVRNSNKLARELRLQ